MYPQILEARALPGLCPGFARAWPGPGPGLAWAFLVLTQAWPGPGPESDLVDPANPPTPVDGWGTHSILQERC